MSQALLEYFDALDRLINKSPRIVSKDTKISNDAVAIEAGRKRGSIKRSRPLFNRLIEAIDVAAISQNNEDYKKNNIDLLKEKNIKLTEKYSTLSVQFENSLSNVVKMSVEILELKKELVRLRGGQVIPLFHPNEKK